MPLYLTSPRAMDLLVSLTLIAISIYMIKSRDQKRRIALLSSYLEKYQLEKLMESLSQGYQRALGEADPERRAQIWNLSTSAELALSEQFNRFVAEFSKVPESEARVSQLAIAIPYADKLFPGATFDARKVLAIHGKGIAKAVNLEHADDQATKDRAYTLSAEMLLMQHTCHWFCRSRTLASARMLGRHQTAYAQLLASVTPETRKAYCALVGT